VALPWCLSFLAVNFLLPHGGGQNSASRFALLRAMARQHTFRIDRFRNWTVDLAVTPDAERHYYSNKAPGPAFLAFPLAVLTAGPADDDHRAGPPDPRREGLTSILVQALPFAALVLLADLLLLCGAPLAARHFFVLAALFGNTSSLLMNTFFGHGATAWLLLALALSSLERKPSLAGLAFGFALLTDYSVAVLLPPAILSVGLAVDRKEWGRAFAHFCAGGILPGLLWTWYHTSCFGSPFTLALQFQNPNLIDDKVAEGRVFGALSPLPDLHAVRGLLVGDARGLLITQPWALLAWAAAIVQARALLRSRAAPLLPIALLGLPILLWLNAGYRGWNGGWCPGPRYLSALMPLLALLMGLAYANIAPAWRVPLWAGLVASLALFVLVMSADDILARPWVPIWDGYFTELRADWLGVHGWRALLAILACAAPATWTAASARPR
jgi:hypothetical protein